MKCHKIFLDVLRKCLGIFGGVNFFPIPTIKVVFFVTIPSSVPGNVKHTPSVSSLGKSESYPASERSRAMIILPNQNISPGQMTQKKMLALPFFWSYQNMLTYIYIEIYIDLLETPLTIEIQVMLKMVKVLATDFASQLSHGKKKLVSRGLSVAEVFRTGGPHKEPHIPIWGTQPADVVWPDMEGVPSNSSSPVLGLPTHTMGFLLGL